MKRSKMILAQMKRQLNILEGVSTDLLSLKNMGMIDSDDYSAIDHHIWSIESLIKHSMEQEE